MEEVQLSFPPREWTYSDFLEAIFPVAERNGIGVPFACHRPPQRVGRQWQSVPIERPEKVRDRCRRGTAYWAINWKDAQAIYWAQPLHRKIDTMTAWDRAHPWRTLQTEEERP